MSASLNRARWVLALGGGFLFFLVLVAIFADVLSPYHPEKNVGPQFAAPSLSHWLGTDVHGRDILTRTLHGARISLLVGFIGAVVSVGVGVVYGMVSGYVGGRLDQLMMRVVDIMAATPRIVVVIVVVAVLDDPLRQAFEVRGWNAAAEWSRMLLIFTVLGLVEWMTMARIIRGQVLALREREFILAARALGQHPTAILLKHLLPNLTGVILVYLTLTIPSVILEESFLSFLGLGMQAPRASWGTLLSEGASMINPIEVYWWMIAGPALFMSLTLLALNFVGDTLRDLWDPRQRGGR